MTAVGPLKRLLVQVTAVPSPRSTCSGGYVGGPAQPSATDGVVLTDLASLPASPVLSPIHFAGPRLTPLQIIRTYGFDEWEAFVLEWAHCLDETYYQVKRHGGSNDRGLDVVGLLSPLGLSAEWDAYQCKHYAKALTPGDAYVEMAKVILAVDDGVYTLPRRYRFMAPLGCGTTLERLLSNPAELKMKFLAKVNDNKPFNDWDRATRDRIAAASESINFDRFGSEQPIDIIDLHKKRSPYHNMRFGGPLPTRPEPQGPPAATSPIETRYVAKLLDAYQEAIGDPNVSLDDVERIKRYRDHLWRQRTAFFSAESLRTFARDQVPPGTFEALQQEVFDGVIEVEQDDHPSGLERLHRVLEVAGTLAIDQNALITVWKQLDRKGMCHQLANNDRLEWVRNCE